VNPKTGKSKGGFKNTLKGRTAEYHGDLHLQSKGFKKLSHDGKLVDLDAPPQGKGLDGVWEKDGKIYITDTKYNTAKLTKLQKSNKWMLEQIDKLDEPLKSKVKKALKEGNLEKRVVHIDVDGNPVIKKWE